MCPGAGVGWAGLSRAALGLENPGTLSVGSQMLGVASASWGAAEFCVLRTSASWVWGPCPLLQKGGPRGAGLGVVEGLGFWARAAEGPPRGQELAPRS